MTTGKVFIVSGPAGVGKSTVCSRMLAHYAGELRKIVTVTTRPPRAGEVDGVDYYFVDEPTFFRYIADDKLAEYANVHKQYYYGTPLDQLLFNIRHGINSLLVIDVEGMKNIRRRLRSIASSIVSIFIMPDALQTLEKRLECRGSESACDIAQRLTSARHEIRMSQCYDYIVSSGTRDEDFLSLQALYNFERTRRIQISIPAAVRSHELSYAVR